MNADYDNFGDFLKDYIREKGYSQRTFAIKKGISENSIKAWCSGKRPAPRPVSLRLLFEGDDPAYERALELTKKKNEPKMPNGMESISATPEELAEIRKRKREEIMNKCISEGGNWPWGTAYNDGFDSNEETNIIEAITADEDDYAEWDSYKIPNDLAGILSLLFPPNLLYTFKYMMPCNDTLALILGCLGRRPPVILNLHGMKIVHRDIQRLEILGISYDNLIMLLRYMYLPDKTVVTDTFISGLPPKTFESLINSYINLLRDSSVYGKIVAHSEQEASDVSATCMRSEDVSIAKSEYCELPIFTMENLSILCRIGMDADNVICRYTAYEDGTVNEILFDNTPTSLQLWAVDDSRCPFLYKLMAERLVTRTVRCVNEPVNISTQIITADDKAGTRTKAFERLVNKFSGKAAERLSENRRALGTYEVIVETTDTGRQYIEMYEHLLEKGGELSRLCGYSKIVKVAQMVAPTGRI